MRWAFLLGDLKKKWVHREVGVLARHVCWCQNELKNTAVVAGAGADQSITYTSLRFINRGVSSHNGRPPIF